MGMRNDDQKPPLEGGVVPRSGRGKHGVFPSSFRALSKIVSSGASTVASTVKSAASAASAIVERDNESSHDQLNVMNSGSSWLMQFWLQLLNAFECYTNFTLKSNS
uniref:Uncharacterized protein LOC104236388 n=1 Tax=Nicotiana sylvestris TaxID=4096 RepID=A0A1U7XG23_NICSY|nr:PREDICTED: uncharacterized protein LOC104236388 [Nicotiana sylvestris]